jgi:CHAT domain-containing protein
MGFQRVVLVEFFAAGNSTLVFGVREDFDEPKVVEIKMPLEEVWQFVKANFRKGHIASMDLARWQRVFGPLVEPVVSWADEGDIVWFVPHDVLHYLPLHALKVDGRYLIERNPVCYSPSASIMKYCRNNRKGARETALVLGDSRSDRELSHAKDEAFAVAGIFNTTPYIGAQATKSLLKDRLQKSPHGIDILHFSCHGYFCSDHALKSGIMLAPEDHSHTGAAALDEEWNLTAEEIFGLPIRADLVTLSACESGVNENRPGDELIGLTRAFVYAGAASVVVSLWKVNDESTRYLMEHFYKELKRGVNKAEALQQAQLRLMKMGFDHLFSGRLLFWSEIGFSGVGECDAFQL